MKEQVKQILILLGAVVLIVGVLLWFSGDSKNELAFNNNGQFTGALTVEQAQYDFGSVSMAKGNVEKEFTIENKSDGDVAIGEVSTSCMCTEAVLRVGDRTAGPFGMPGHGLTRKANLVVKPGEQLIAKVIFDPAAHGPAGIGPVERQIAVYTSADKDPMVLNFKAVVTP
ncbi:MAG: DUF1573 domain-containing protein [Candidatus Azambacteria bacterium]|nr:DUF1573 domain-containing protein [Candidatus Azambacteria bacterium]